jgi:membrane protease YdiL (CAAX protease family)
MVQEAATAVLRDFENVVWLALIIGLLGCAVWRFFSSRPDEEGGAARPPREHGVPTEQFSGADLVVLPMVLVKYSFVLVVAATFLFSLPERFFAALGLAPEPAAVKPDIESQLNETVELTPELIGLDLLLNIMLVSLVIVMIQWVGRADPAEIFGFRRWKWKESWKLLLWIGAGSAIALPAVQSIVVVSHQGLQSIFGKSLEDQVAVQSLREADKEPLIQILLIAQACIVAPIVEEVIFRGYLYGVLKRFTGAMFAAFIGASLFAVAHNNLPVVLPLWGFAIFLTLFYEASRSLWVPIGMHAVFNSVQVYRLLESGG